MKYPLIILLVIFIGIGCTTKSQKTPLQKLFLTNEIPEDSPIPLMPELVSSDSLIHRGIFSNDYSVYYYTVSDKSFSKFDVKVIKNENGKWSKSKNAFFNSVYNDHGMSFSPDGNTLYFSSTRPTNLDSVANTWHIWKSEKRKEKWNTPEFVDIPNLHDKLVSHPSIANDGTLYFHSSNLDYSDMSIYYASQKDGKFQNANKINLTPENTTGYCTPYISPDNKYLIYATIGDPLKLNISYKNDDDEWSKAKELPEIINQNGQGNPYLTPNGKFLFYARENSNTEKGWNVYWVSTASFINE